MRQRVRQLRGRRHHQRRQPEIQASRPPPVRVNRRRAAQLRRRQGQAAKILERLQAIRMRRARNRLRQIPIIRTPTRTIRIRARIPMGRRRRLDRLRIRARLRMADRRTQEPRIRDRIRVLRTQDQTPGLRIQVRAPAEVRLRARASKQLGFRNARAGSPARFFVDRNSVPLDSRIGFVAPAGILRLREAVATLRMTASQNPFSGCCWVMQCMVPSPQTRSPE